jgi:hypothetical protein
LLWLLAAKKKKLQLLQQLLSLRLQLLTLLLLLQLQPLRLQLLTLLLLLPLRHQLLRHLLLRLQLLPSQQSTNQLDEKSRPSGRLFFCLKIVV